MLHPDAICLLARHLAGSPAPRWFDREARIRYVLTARSETPLPGRSTFLPLVEASAHTWTLGAGPDRLVTKATARMRELALLPIDPEDEALVDRLILDRDRRSGSRPLLRRRG